MIYVLAPSYNDAQNLPKLIKNVSNKLQNQKHKIIIINDGSSDNIKWVIQKLKSFYNVVLIGYTTNQGPGFAFKFGFNYLIKSIKPEDIIVTIEADNSCDISILNKMIGSVDETYDLILSSPYAKGGNFKGLSLERKILSNISNILDSLIFRIKTVKTYSSFYRVYKGSLLIKGYERYKSSLITDAGFSGVVELLLKLSACGAKICEIPATLNWEKRKGKSKMKIFRTVLNHIILYVNYFQGKYK